MVQTTSAGDTRLQQADDGTAPWRAWGASGGGGKVADLSPKLTDFAGRVSDSGEGRWTSVAAIEEGVPAPVLTAALYSRFGSRHRDEVADKALSAQTVRRSRRETVRLNPASRAAQPENRRGGTSA